jgi:hypothetical protein
MQFVIHFAPDLLPHWAGLLHSGIHSKGQLVLGLIFFLYGGVDVLTLGIGLDLVFFIFICYF